MTKKLIFAALLSFSCLLATAQMKQVSGVVQDSSGQPVIGASVIELNVTPPNGVTTDVNGIFTLSVKEGATLSVSSIGYLHPRSPWYGSTDPDYNRRRE